MNHSEEPAKGCIRETQEELGITVELEDRQPVITQRSFFRDGVSFVSFTYCGIWNGTIDDLNLKKEKLLKQNGSHWKMRSITQYLNLTGSL